MPKQAADGVLIGPKKSAAGPVPKPVNGALPDGNDHRRGTSISGREIEYAPSQDIGTGSVTHDDGSD